MGGDEMTSVRRKARVYHPQASFLFVEATLDRLALPVGGVGDTQPIANPVHQPRHPG